MEKAVLPEQKPHSSWPGEGRCGQESVLPLEMQVETGKLTQHAKALLGSGNPEGDSR